VACVRISVSPHKEDDVLLPLLAKSSSFRLEKLPDFFVFDRTDTNCM
jgi:hypothetical protein